MFNLKKKFTLEAGAMAWQLRALRFSRGLVHPHSYSHCLELQFQRVQWPLSASMCTVYCTVMVH